APPADAPGGHLAVVVDGELGAELAVGLRASLPARVAVTFVAPSDVDGLPAEQPVLVVDADLVPEPPWVQALWAAPVRSSGAAGVRVVAPEGRLVHAGGAADGRPFGAGAEWGHAPLFTAARTDAALLAPFVAPAGALRAGGPVRGAYLGHVAAVS